MIDFGAQYGHLFSENDVKFFDRIYSGGLEKYTHRLRQIGFTGMERVLDAGCGFGQWSFALAGLNHSIEACDVASERLLVAERIQKEQEILNVRFQYGSLESIPLEDSSVDAIFCYGVFFLAEPKKALQEFSRVLKEGGKVYVSLNGLGWYLNLWCHEPNKAGGFSPKESAARAFANANRLEKGEPLGEGGVILEKEQFGVLAQETGFEILEIASDGEINYSEGESISFFKGEYLGQTGVYEVLMQKA